MTEEFYKTKREKELYMTSWDIYPKLLKKIEIGKEEKILDAGCGNGELSNHLMNFNLYGFDFSEDAIKKAEKKNYKKVIKSEIYNTPFKNDEFDKTICIEVLEYLSHPEKAFKELLRVTKKEIIISSANFNWYRINSHLSKEMRKQYKGQLAINKNFINSKFLRTLAKEDNIELNIFYLSNKFGFIRNLFGDFLASEVIGVFKVK